MSRLIPFTLRAPHNMPIRKILIQEASIYSVIVEKTKITVKMQGGYDWVNLNPSKADTKFWYQYKRSDLVSNGSKRWDMPSPDPMALEQLR